MIGERETVVPGYGRTPNRVMVVGEAPGAEEAERGRPFVGRSGVAQEDYVRRHGRTTTNWYRTNVVKTYLSGNPDPTPELVERWTPTLESEVQTVRPQVIVAVGRFAARWFLGPCSMEQVHGMPHHGGAFDPRVAHRARGAVVVPVYHPALGFYSPDSAAAIAWDYGRACEVVAAVERGEKIATHHDAWAGRERYRDVDGQELSDYVRGARRIAVDTEGLDDRPWSVQASTGEGHAVVWRVERNDGGMHGLQDAVRDGAEIILHNGMYDLAVAEAIGLDFYHPSVRLLDTMYAAYLLRLEPQGLKALAWRWAGMRMTSYRETVGKAGEERQVAYLQAILAHPWPRPEPRLVRSNDGTARLYRPQALDKRVVKLLSDYTVAQMAEESGADEETALAVDLDARWRSIPGDMRSAVEAKLGPWPTPGVWDLPLYRAVYYSARDADATWRVWHALEPELERLDVRRTLDEGMRVMPVFAEMQSEGMLASRRKFESLALDVEERMEALQQELSGSYFGGRPFNPASSPHVATLMRRRGLVGEKMTATGRVSTSKKSIEHLRHSDPAIALVVDWREHQKIRDAFCAPILERIPPAEDVYPVRCQIKTTRVASRRIAAANPNLLQIPTRHELGRRVRDCYVAPPGQVLGSWDLSQIEMRYMAHASNDPLLCQLFREQRDVHSETAARIFGVPLDQVDKVRHRYPAKRAGFGIIYGISGPGLYDQLRMMGEGADAWDVESSEDLIRGWLDVYGGVREYIERVGAEVRETGVVRDDWGMVRYLPGAWSRDPKTRAEAARQAVSHRIQGGAQGWIQHSMGWLRNTVRDMQDAGMEVRWCLQVHDEIILRFDEKLWDVLNALVLEALTEHGGIDMRVPVEADGRCATSWGALK